jgi:hypothetical protein
MLDLKTPGPGTWEYRNMAAVSGDGGDHRRRVLEHLEKAASETCGPGSTPSDRQLKIPLIGEVRRPEPATPKRERRRSAEPFQPRLEDS